jgi:hypothetical protein
LRVLSICIVVMKNGYTIIGKSAPASPENFDPELGRQFAYEDAVRQVWPLMRHALRERLTPPPTTDAEAAYSFRPSSAIFWFAVCLTISR